MTPVTDTPYSNCVNGGPQNRLLDPRRLTSTKTR